MTLCLRIILHSKSAILVDNWQIWIFLLFLKMELTGLWFGLMLYSKYSKLFRANYSTRQLQTLCLVGKCNILLKACILSYRSGQFVTCL